MTDEQKKLKAMILADLKLALVGGGSDDKYERLLGAYHVQQAIEKTIKLKAGIEGLNLWGHDIDHLLNECEKANIDIKAPAKIRQNAVMYTSWEADCRYYPSKIIRKDSIFAAHRVTMEWLQSGDTK